VQHSSTQARSPSRSAETGSNSRCQCRCIHHRRRPCCHHYPAIRGTRDSPRCIMIYVGVNLRSTNRKLQHTPDHWLPKFECRRPATANANLAVRWVPIFSDKTTLNEITYALCFSQQLAPGSAVTRQLPHCSQANLLFSPKTGQVNLTRIPTPRAHPTASRLRQNHRHCLQAHFGSNDLRPNVTSCVKWLRG
jgi:hypothetical protein